MKGEEQEVKQAAQDIGKSLGGDVLQNLSALVDNVLLQGMPFKDALGVSNAKIEAIYSQAYQMYNSGKFTDAIQLFRLLLVLEPMESKHYMGLAACQHMIKEYENAIKAYGFAGIIDPQTPVPFFHASDCYLQMRDKTSAIIMLDMAVQRAGEHPEYQTLKDRALMMITSLKKEIKATQA